MRISDWSSDVCSSDLRGASDPLPSRLGLCLQASIATGRRFEIQNATTMLAVATRAMATEIGRFAFSPMLSEMIAPTIRSETRFITLISGLIAGPAVRSEEHTSELQSLMRNADAVV